MFPAYLVQEWSVKNAKPLGEYTPGSNFKAWWICTRGHEWRTLIAERCRKGGRATGCPQCVGRQPAGSKLSDYLHLAAEWSEKNKKDIDNYSVGSHYRAWWTCSRGHEWQTMIFGRARKHKPTGCPQCAGRRSSTKLVDYLLLLAEWSEKNSKPITEYTTGSNYKAWWICSAGHEWEARIKARVGGVTNCPECRKDRRGTRRKDNLTDHPHLVAEWSEKNTKPISDYRPGSAHQAWWKCAAGHEWEARIGSRTSGTKSGCPVCNVGGRGRKRKRGEPS